MRLPNLFLASAALTMAVHAADISRNYATPDNLNNVIQRYIAAQRKQIVTAFENWWDKYRVTLNEIEQKRDAAALGLQGFLRGLGYV